VDQHGVALDILVQEKRDGAAAKRFFRHLLQGLQYKPKRLITDGLRSYGVARRALLPDVKHRISRYLTDVFDKYFFEGPCYCRSARTTAWPRAGIGMQARRAA
jgi:transposase-like protein